MMVLNLVVRGVSYEWRDWRQAHVWWFHHKSPRGRLSRHLRWALVPRLF